MNMTEEQKLLEKLRRVEALFAGTDVAGEKDAAAQAAQRLRERLTEFKKVDPPREFQFSMPDMWTRRLFTALLRRYGIEPFRYRGQRYTTVMAWVPKRFLDETLWPEYMELSKILQAYMDDITTRVISETIHGDVSDAAERKELAPGR